jgi:hypothetical protein
MKYVVGYSVWEKVDMIAWLLDGIVRNFDPKDTEVVFHFDVCEDDSVKAFSAMTEFWLTLKGFKWTMLYADPTQPEVREVGGHNAILKHCMANSDAHFFIIAQDDQHFNQPLAPSLEDLAARYGERLGVIGGRDGYDWGYGRFAGSFWSESALHERLKHGEWRERPCLNTGPLVYNRTLVSAVGYQDTDYTAFYVWDDYALRAQKAGFVNGVLGMDLTHAKFGRIKASTWYTDPALAARDIQRVKQKHGLA